MGEEVDKRVDGARSQGVASASPRNDFGGNEEVSGFLCTACDPSHWWTAEKDEEGHYPFESFCEHHPDRPLRLRIAKRSLFDAWCNASGPKTARGKAATAGNGSLSNKDGKLDNNKNALKNGLYMQGPGFITVPHPWPTDAESNEQVPPFKWCKLCQVQGPCKAGSFKICHYMAERTKGAFDAVVNKDPEAHAMLVAELQTHGTGIIHLMMSYILDKGVAQTVPIAAGKDGDIIGYRDEANPVLALLYRALKDSNMTFQDVMATRRGVGEGERADQAAELIKAMFGGVGAAGGPPDMGGEA